MHAATPYGTAVPELKGLAPACGRSLSTNSCFQSGCLGRNPPASTAHTAIRSRPCQLSRRALQPTRPLGSPSPSPAGTPLRAGRHQSRVPAPGRPSGARSRLRVSQRCALPGAHPSFPLTAPPSRHAGSAELCQNTSEGDTGAKAPAQPPLANCSQRCGCERAPPLHPRHTSVTPQKPGTEVLTPAIVNCPTGALPRSSPARSLPR